MTSQTVNEILDVVADLRQVVLYFLGGVDVGKTSLVTALANRLLGNPIAILDADIGQSGVLPFTISLLRVERPFATFSQLSVVRQEFIPGYNLVRYQERNARAMSELVQEARRWARYCLVDTTGFVTGVGISLKRREIEGVQPDLIVALQRSHELRPILRDLRYPSLVFPVPPAVEKKSWEERRRRRNERLHAYFQGATLRELPVKGPASVSPQHEGRIVGLYGEAFLGLGLVTEVGGERLVVLTPVTGKLRKVEFTPIRFNLGRCVVASADTKEAQSP